MGQQNFIYLEALSYDVMETTNAMREADCTECDEETAEFRAYERTHEMMPEEPEDAHVTRQVRCTGCGAVGSISVTYDGTEAGGCVSFDDAQWNQPDEEENDE